jgi:hypothetical protein
MLWRRQQSLVGNAVEGRKRPSDKHLTSGQDLSRIPARPPAVIGRMSALRGRKRQLVLSTYRTSRPPNDDSTTKTTDDTVAR